MNNYYRRSGTTVSRSKRVVENDKRNIKYKYKLLLAIIVTIIATGMSYVGYDYTIFLVPAITNLVLLLGGFETTKQVIGYVLPFILVLPVSHGILNGSTISQMILQIAMLTAVLFLVITYRPFLWKRSVLIGDLPLWYFILFGAVTNGVTGTVLLLLILIKTLISTLINLGLHFAVRALVTGEEIYKWTEQS